MKTKLFNRNLSLVRFIPISFLLMFLCKITTSQDVRTEVAGIPINYDEDKVGNYTLPNPLVLLNGKKVKSAETWFSERRPEILKLFTEEQFGKYPDRSRFHFHVFESGTPAFENKAIRKQVTLYFTEDTSDYKADLLMYLPAGDKPLPLFLSINFFPNSLMVEDPAVRKGMMWNRDGQKVPVQESRRFSMMDVEKFISHGIGVAFIYYGDVEPDFPDGIQYGIRGHYLKTGETWPAPNEWGTISAWAWGLSCAMDYLQTDQQVDAEKVAVYGVSRLGKTVLWAGAIDPRYGMVIASCSGEGGAALSMRNYGETIKHMVDSTRYFYQFCGNRGRYADDPQTCPVDAHMLISLIAPRPLLLQTGDTDGWSDPKGEFLAAVAAAPVYKLLGKKALETAEMPDAGVPILNDLGYYMHAGGHGVKPEDFDIYLEFMKSHFIIK